MKISIRRFFTLFLMSLLSASFAGAMEHPLNINAKTIASGINQLSFDLSSWLMKKDENVVFSPLSLSSALAMTYAGARKETADAMQRVLHFMPNEESFHSSYGFMMNNLVRQGRDEKEATFLIANDLWMQHDYPVLESFTQRLKTSYQAEPMKLDFASDPDMATKTINDKVSLKTKKEIPNLISKLERDTRFVITNALFFQAPWATPFNEAMTRDKTFALADSTTKAHPFMVRTGRLSYAGDELMECVKIPYKGGDFSAVVMLPREGMMDKFGESMNAQNFVQMLSKTKDRSVRIELPKFSVRTSVSSMKDVFSAMGMGILFSDMADLSAIDGKGMIKVSDVIHQAVVEVTEQGTKAAAATAVVIVEKTAIIQDPEMPINFFVNRPFYFFIIDNSNDAILFMVRVMNPTL